MGLRFDDYVAFAFPRRFLVQLRNFQSLMDEVKLKNNWELKDFLEMRCIEQIRSSNDLDQSKKVFCFQAAYIMWNNQEM